MRNGGQQMLFPPVCRECEPSMKSAAPGVTGLYVHVPFCDGKCPYCAFYSIRYESRRVAAYLESAARELDLATAEFGPLVPRTIYLGGGTPTVLSAAELAELCRILRCRVSVARIEEWTAEANPGTLSLDHLRVLRKAGVNRISIGAQSFDDRVLRRLGRRHASADVVKSCRLAGDAGFDNVGLDLITGVPGFPSAVWNETLRKALDLNPKHLSVYALTVEEGTALGHEVQRGLAAAPEPSDQVDVLDAAEALLEQAGYRRYEISNYARPGFECRHNLACWRGEQYIGLGPGAASHVGMRRWTNAPDLEAYGVALARGSSPPRETEELTPETKATELLVFGLRMFDGISLEDVGRRSGLSDSRQVREWATVLRRLQTEGLIERQGDRWRLTPRGRNLADHVAVELMP